MVRGAWKGIHLVVLVATFASVAGCGSTRSRVATPARNPSQRSDAGGALNLSGLGYHIGPEDLLRISVWNNPALTIDLTVRPDGKISVPLIQDVQAAGLTPVDLSDVIHAKLLEYIKDPHVSVIVLQVNSPKYYVVGAVKNPGTYPLRGDVFLLQAISIAGGFTPFAAVRSIRLVRNVGGRQEVRTVNYYNLIEDHSKWNYVLKQGDTIVVPE